MRETALRVAAAQIADQIVVEADAPAFEKQRVGATARTVQTLRASALDEHSGRDWSWVVVSLAAVTLRDLTDHQRGNLDHRRQPYTSSSAHVSVNDRHGARVFRIRRDFGDDRRRVAGVIAPAHLVIVPDHAGHRRMVIMVLVRRQPKDRKISTIEGPKPFRFVLSEQFFEFEELALEKERRGFMQ